MQVLPIQSQNNYYKPNFKATLVNDSNGYFRRLWQSANKNQSLKSIINDFYNKPRHKVEIVDYTEDKSFGYYTLLNHATGKTHSMTLTNKISSELALYDLLYHIRYHGSEFFNVDEEGRLYQRLTGQ